MKSKKHVPCAIGTMVVFILSGFLFSVAGGAFASAEDPGLISSTLGRAEGYFKQAVQYPGKNEYSIAASKVGEGEDVLRCVEPSGGGDAGTNLSTAPSQVAEATIPAVVHIEVTERREVPNPLAPLEENPLLQQFFGLPKNMPKKLEQEVTGLGTGMIVDSRGHILTNNHVVEGATQIKVVLSDGQEYSARVVGTDPKTDLAIIKIQPKKTLPHVRFGDSDKVKVAQWVIAIGHPRGLGQTVTQGIISAKHRTGITDPSGYQDFLQTDAAINPGNSGGPLLNLEGEVIGVNSAIATRSGGSEGIAFAIPSNMAIHVANELIAQGKVVRGWLGVSIQEITPDKVQSLGLSSPEGAVVADVMKSGPADKAGIKVGDVILSFGGQKIKNAADLRNRVASTPVGKEVPVTLWRGRQQEQVTVKTGNLEDLERRMISQVKTHLGVTVGPVTSKEAQKYGMPIPMGVVIQSVDPNGPIGKAKLEKGDIILAIGDQPIESVDMFLTMVEALPHHQKISMIAVDHRSGQKGVVEVDIS